MISRRSFFTGLVASLAAPAIVHAGNLMPIRGIALDYRALNAGLDSELYAELTRITRLAMLPRLFTQVYNNPPRLVPWHDWLANDLSS